METIGRTRYRRFGVLGRNGFVVVIVQLAPEEPRSPEALCGRQAWKDDYPWLHRAVKEIGPGARGALDRWRVRIEDELKTTLDFKVRPDGTATVSDPRKGGLATAARRPPGQTRRCPPPQLQGYARRGSPPGCLSRPRRTRAAPGVDPGIAPSIGDVDLP